MSEIRERSEGEAAATLAAAAPWNGMHMALRIICLAGIVGMMVLIGHGILKHVRQDLVTTEAVREQHRDDVAWMLLRDAARRHLAAVRSGSSEVPDRDLDSALIEYAWAGKHFFRKGDRDPTPGLADLRTAADGLRPLDAPRIMCAGMRTDGTPAACTAYFDAMVGLFGREL